MTASAQVIYDQLEARLATPEYTPRALYERFDIEVLCTTDAPWDRLSHHQALRASAWQADIRPTFRPDAVVNFLVPGWHANIEALGEVSGRSIDSFSSFIQILEERRAYFRSLGATATDQSAESAFTAELTASEAETIFQRALSGQATADDARRFTGHMLMESARMSIEDGAPHPLCNPLRAITGTGAALCPYPRAGKAGAPSDPGLPGTASPGRSLPSGSRTLLPRGPSRLSRPPGTLPQLPALRAH